MNEVSEKLISFRNEWKLTQSDLAKAIGVSQATVSRLESADESPRDLRLLSKIAKVLQCTVSDLIPGRGPRSGAFSAFCPNPFCATNERKLDDNRTPTVVYQSVGNFPSASFDETNYCPRCATELIKECPNCKGTIRTPGARYCMACGARIFDRPTKEEWDKLAELLKEKVEDIPF